MITDVVHEKLDFYAYAVTQIIFWSLLAGYFEVAGYVIPTEKLRSLWQFERAHVVHRLDHMACVCTCVYSVM